MATTKEIKDELTIARFFDAPRERVWKAWTEPERMKKWWGPQYFTAPVINIDLRAGGKYLYCMRGPDNKDYWSTGVYREIVPMERLVLTDSFADEKGNVVPASYYGMTGDWPRELLVTVTFEEIGSMTKMHLKQEGIPSGQMRDLTRAGWSGSFDKLAESIVPIDRTRIIAEPGKQEIIITRVFDAPRKLVFQAYTDHNLITQWWGPERFTTSIDKLSAKPGGAWRFVQNDRKGNIFAFHGVYHDVVSPARIVDTFEYEGRPGHVSLETTTFEEFEGKTRVTNRSTFQSVADRDEMIEADMEEGVMETNARLAELLAKYRVARKAA